MQKYTSVVDVIFHKNMLFLIIKTIFSSAHSVCVCMLTLCAARSFSRFWVELWVCVWVCARIVQCLLTPNRTLTHLNYIHFLHSPAQIKLVFFVVVAVLMFQFQSKNSYLLKKLSNHKLTIYFVDVVSTHSAPSINEFFNTDTSNNKHEIYLFIHFCQMCCGHLTIG